MNTFAVICVLALITSPSWALGKKPASQEEPKKESESGLKRTENGANEALDGVERGVKGAVGAVSTGGNKALQAVDDTVHGRNRKDKK